MTASANQFGQWTTGQYTRFSGGTEYANVSQTFTADDRVRPAEFSAVPSLRTRGVSQPTDTPTVVTRYVNTDNVGTANGLTKATGYTTLNAALSALESTDWQAANQQLRIECYGVAADTTSATVSATWTGKLSPACFLDIVGDQPNSLQYSTGNYRLEPATDATGLTVSGGDYVRVRIIAVRTVADAAGVGFPAVLVSVGADVRLDRVHAYASSIDAARTSNVVAFQPAQATGRTTFTNCIARGYKTTGQAHKGWNGQSTEPSLLYGCAAIDCQIGYASSSGHPLVVKNCGAKGCVDGYNGAFGAGNTNNASDLASDAPGTNARNSVTPVFVNEGAGNYHLDPSDTAWRDQGADLSADVALWTLLDGDGQARTGTWDIGPDEAALAYSLAADAGSYAITGAAASVLATRVMAGTAGAYAETGAAARTAKGYAIAAVAGAYTETGAAATVQRTRLVAATVGNYVITGGAAQLSVARSVAASAGAYTETGAAASLTVARTVAAIAGAYSISGGAARLTLGHLVAGSAGVYTITGAAADLVYAPTSNNYVLTANAGAYTVTGTDAWVARSLLGQSSAGAYAETGDDAALAVGRVLRADAGAYAETGADAALSTFTGNFVLSAEAGVYGITGAAAFLRAIQQGTGGGGTTIAGIVGIPFEVERRRKREPEPEAVAEPEAPSAAAPEPEAPPAVAPEAAAPELVEVAAVAEQEAVAVAPEAPTAPEPPSVEIPAAEVERIVEALEQLEALETIEREAMAAAEVAEPEPEIEVQLETEAALAPEAPLEEIAPEPEPVAEIAEPEVQAVAPEPALLVQPSPVTVTIQAATPQEAAAELVRQIEQPRGMFTAADMAALALAMTIALED